MKVIPAIDLKDGQCVRLQKGDYGTAHKVAENAVETARRFLEAGASLIHMVDLDAAKDGSHANYGVVEQVIRETGATVELGGGIVVMDDGKVLGELQLQIAGIMSEAPLIEVNEALENAKEQAFKLGVSRGVDPFMTLSFMALTVIPTLRLTTRGVFDVINQRYV
mgnify:CR=1 FL=1